MNGLRHGAEPAARQLCMSGSTSRLTYLAISAYLETMHSINLVQGCTCCNAELRSDKTLLDLKTMHTIGTTCTAALKRIGKTYRLCGPGSEH